MQNHKKITVNYNCNDILDILKNYPLPKEDSANVDACSREDVNKISKILNLNLPIKSILYFRISKSFKGYIHMDKNLNNPNSSLIKHALNFPLSHCNDVYMRWYEQIDTTINDQPFGGPSNGSPTPCLNYNNARYIDEANCDQINLVNILDWHAVENRSLTECGHLISVRFESYVKTSFDKPFIEWLKK